MKQEPRRAPKQRESNPLERTHALLAPALGHVFEELRLSAALTDGTRWNLIHAVPNVVAFELGHLRERARSEYNRRSIASAQKKGQPVLGEHAGFCDLFVPVFAGRGGVLVSGPFAVCRPTSQDLEERWRSLTGTQARVSDAEFVHYLSMTLATATFDELTLPLFQRFATTFCTLLASKGAVERSATEAALLRSKLAKVRLAERTWEAAALMVDERTFRSWTSTHFLTELAFLGLSRQPEHALVGLLAARDDEKDPIDEMLRRDALQRAAVDLAKKIGGLIVGRIGEHGIFLLVGDAARGSRLRAKLLELGERTRLLARRFGFRLHLGLHAPDHPGPLPARFKSALSAAEKALSEGMASKTSGHGVELGLGLGELRRALARAVRAAPSSLAQRFDRYLDAAAAHSGYRLDSTRAHAEAGFDEVVQALGGESTFDERSWADLKVGLKQSAAAGTVHDLLNVYRAAIASLAGALLRPKAAEHERSLERALTYIREHAGEELTLSQVAKVAGFAPSYFSRLFAASERTTFQKYLAGLRVERAQSMLESTDVAIERVGKLSGFRSRTRFHLAFKQACGVTPAGYRERCRA